MELLSALGVNVQLLLAQVVNFTILVVILLYFVYRPILRLIDNRRDMVKRSVEDAKTVERQKREIEQFKIEQMRKADQEMSSILEQAKKQGEAVKREIVEKAQTEADALVEKAKESLNAERRKMLDESKQTLATAVVRLTEKVLEREFGDADQQRLLKNLEKDLPALLR
jgi:F-type H+-transporting ATPase subunit b